MADVLKSGSALVLPLKQDTGADSVSLSVEISGAVSWADATKQPIAANVTFPAAASVISGWGSFAYFIVQYWNGDNLVSTERAEVIIEAAEALRVLDNSFATWGDLQFAANYMVDIHPFKFASESEQRAALIQAYHNIGDVQVDFCPPHRRARYWPQNRIWDDTGIFETDLDRIYSTRQLKEETWAKLKPIQKEKLIRAQIIEASFLLAGMTPEKQRLSGLLSHSAGESAHFYRTTKPLELPVCRAAALELKGVISYALRIGG